MKNLRGGRCAYVRFGTEREVIIDMCFALLLQYPNKHKELEYQYGWRNDTNTLSFGAIKTMISSTITGTCIG
jgi:hypothetical protein